MGSGQNSHNLSDTDFESGPDSDEEPGTRSYSYEYSTFLDQNNHPHDFPYHMYPFKYPAPVPEIDDQDRADIYEVFDNIYEKLNNTGSF